MKTNRIFSAFVAVLLTSTSLFAQGSKDERTFIVRTGKPSRETISQTIKKTGGIVSPHEVKLSTKVGGRLVTLALPDGTPIEEGALVKKGDKIALIDGRDYKARLASADAQVSSAQATFVDTKRELDRMELLFKEGTATERERDNASAAYERAVAALEQAKAQKELAEIELDETTITSPIDGAVSVRAVEEGMLLSAGTHIVTVTQMTPLRFSLSVPTTLFEHLVADKTAISIEVDAYPGKMVEGKLTRIFPVADAQTRTVRIEAEIDNRDGLYVPGMYAVGTIALASRENVLVVPYDAVVRNDKENIIYTVKDGVAHATKVKLGIRQDAVVEVLEGLLDGDEIVIAGQHRLTDGAKVKNEVL